MFPRFRRKSLRYRKKSLVILAIICISSSTIYKVCVISENFYKKHYLLPEVKEFELRNVPSATRLVYPNSQNASQRYINSILTTSRIRHQLKQKEARNCSDSECSQLLSLEDASSYKGCTRSAAKRGPIKPGNCLFLNSTGRQPIGLASFPGSGNTWMRGLLQKVTGFCTGSLYCDRDLRRHGFPGESIKSGSVLVAKTHNARSKALLHNEPCNDGSNCSFEKAIFIIRDPFRAMISEWNREIRTTDTSSSSHTSGVGKEYFGSNSQWSDFVSKSMRYWVKMVTFWVLTWSLSHQLYIVKYEDIVQNTNHEVSKVLRFIGVHVEEDDVNEKLQDGYSAFHRKVHSNFTHFTINQTAAVNKYLEEIQRKMVKIGFHLSLDNYTKTDPI